MSYEAYDEEQQSDYDGSESQEEDSGQDEQQKKYQDEVYSQRVPAGRRTYYLDVKPTRSGDDYYITITERKRLREGGSEKFKVFLYKEDFGKFIRALHDVMDHIRDERLPEYDFRKLPEDMPGPVDSDE
jgi:hypothetical protein